MGPFFCSLLAFAFPGKGRRTILAVPAPEWIAESSVWHGAYQKTDSIQRNHSSDISGEAGLSISLSIPLDFLQNMECCFFLLLHLISLMRILEDGAGEPPQKGWVWIFKRYAMASPAACRRHRLAMVRRAPELSPQHGRRWLAALPAPAPPAGVRGYRLRRRTIFIPAKNTGCGHIKHPRSRGNRLACIQHLAEKRLRPGGSCDTILSNKVDRQCTAR